MLPRSKIDIISATFTSSENISFLTHKLNRLQMIGEIIGPANLISLMSMSPDKVAFLVLSAFFIASTSFELVGERKNEKGQ